jgi:hypothetical protein
MHSVFAFFGIGVPALLAVWLAELPKALALSWGGAGFVFTLAGLALSLAVLRTRRGVDRELQRAAAEWPVLCRELAPVVAAGGDVDAVLAARGYRESLTRRFLVRRLHREYQRDLLRVGSPPAVRTPGLPVPRAPVAVARLALDLHDLPFERDPAARVWVGIGITLLSLAFCTRDTRLWAWGEFGLFAGLMTLAVGLQDYVRLRRQRREVARAMAEWRTLRDELAVVQANAGNLALELQRRGYRSYEVRRWLQARLAQT